jgi:hypothetical protein
VPRVFEVTGALHGRYIVTFEMKALAAQSVSRVTQLFLGPPGSLIEALGAFGAAFHARAMPADRVLHGEAQEAVTGHEP